MKTSAPHVLRKQDGEKLIGLLNEVAELVPRMVGHNDLYLHYREGGGWRVRFVSGDEGAKDWITAPGPWSGLLDALRAEVVPIRAQLAQNDRRQQQRNERRQRKGPTKRRKKPPA